MRRPNDHVLKPCVRAAGCRLCLVCAGFLQARRQMPQKTRAQGAVRQLHGRILPKRTWYVVLSGAVMRHFLMRAPPLRRDESLALRNAQFCLDACRLQPCFPVCVTSATRFVHAANNQFVSCCRDFIDALPFSFALFLWRVSHAFSPSSEVSEHLQSDISLSVVPVCICCSFICQCLEPAKHILLCIECTVFLLCKLARTARGRDWQICFLHKGLKAHEHFVFPKHC